MTFAAFLRKELMEIMKTSKIIILPALFLFFGILSPLSARYMNDIMSLVGEQQGISIKLPDPTFVVAYEQFFKNIYFMMIIVTILIFAGTVSEEKMKGTIVLVLTKCLSRNGFIIGKLLAAILLFTFSYVVGTIICVYYTSLLFPEFINTGIWVGLAVFWLFGILMLTLTLLTSLLCRSMTTSAVAAFTGYVVVSAIAALPYAGRYSPGALQGLSSELASGSKVPVDALIPAAVTFSLAVALVITAILTFKKQEL